MEIDVFISYHTSSSKHIVESIVNKLENGGIRCWYAHRDVQGRYAESIAKAIDSCRIFLVVLNKEASESEDVLNEIELAKEGLKGGDIEYIVPFRTSEGEISHAAKYYLKGMHWIDAVEPPMEDRIAELADRIGMLIGRNVAKKESSSKKMQLCGTPMLPNHNFIGRDNELKQIKCLLEEEGIVFLHGLGGSGKTEIAKKYALMHKEVYSTAIFARYETNLQDMIISDKYFKINGFERITKLDGEKETDAEYAQRKLEKIKELSDKNTLIIIDNFDTESDSMLQNVLEGPYHLIVTTRMSYEDAGLSIIPVSSLEPDEQKQLFLQSYKHPVKPAESSFIDEIIAFVNGHTLAIELLAKLMANKRIKAEVMLRQLKESGINSELKGNVSHGFQKADSVYSHIKLLYRTESLSDSEKFVMMNLSIFPLSGVDIDDFIELCEIEDGEEINGLINRSWIQYDPQRDAISLHPIIAEVVRNECKVDFEKCSVLMKNLAKRFGTTWNMDASQRIECGEIAKFIYHRYPLKEKENVGIYREMLKIFMNLEYYGICEKLLSEMKKVIGTEDSIELGNYYYHIADMHLWMMDYDEAVKYMLQSITVLERIAPESYDIAYMIKHLAHTYHAMYNHREKNTEYLAKAKECLEKSGPIFEKCVPKTHPQIGSQYYAYGLNCYYYGDYETALEYELKSYDIFYKINGDVDSDTTAPMRILALIYSKLGRFEDSESMAMRVLEARRQLWDEKSFKYFEYHETFADIYYENGYVDKALEHLRYVLECIGDRHEEFALYIKKITNKIEEYGK